MTCSYDAGTRRVTIQLSAAMDAVTISRIGNGIAYSGGGPLALCGAARVTNTNRIVVTATGPGQQAVTLVMTNGRFEPGRTHESSGVSEIEFQLDLGAGSDGVIVHGTNGADNLRLGTGGANLNGDGDVDVTTTGADGWSFYGGQGADRIGVQGGLGTGSAYHGNPFTLGETYVNGEGGNDLLVGGPERETFNGGAGSDRLKAGGGNDLMYGDSGADRLEGGADGDGLYPGAGNDLVIGGGGRDSFGAEAGADGSDEFRGGPGRDRASYFGRVGAVRVDTDNRADDGATGEHDNIRADVENIDGGDGDDRLTGNGVNNELDGWGGADTLVGGGGDDELTGDLGGDTLKGGADDDLVDGGPGTDGLYGGADEDEIVDGPDPDVMNAGPGMDTIDQGASPNGADVIFGGPGLDDVTYANRAALVNVSLNNLVGDGGAGENDNVRDDVEAVIGTPFGDTLSGNGLANFLIGGGGVDFLFGFDGIDRLVGDADGDTLNGGDGFDTLDGGSENDTLNANDGSRDEVDGGAGVGDVCNVDPSDFVAGCP